MKYLKLVVMILVYQLSLSQNIHYKVNIDSKLDWHINIQYRNLLRDLEPEFSYYNKKKIPYIPIYDSSAFIVISITDKEGMINLDEKEVFVYQYVGDSLQLVHKTQIKYNKTGFAAKLLGIEEKKCKQYMKWKVVFPIDVFPEPYRSIIRKKDANYLLFYLP